jgi:hypothetical protein
MGAHRTRGIEKCGPRTAAARRAWLPFLTTLLVVGLAITPAHASGVAGHAHPGPSAVPVVMLLLAATALGIVAAGRCRRPAAILALGLLVGVFGVESAVHSAHHFSDPQGAASCALFAASQHDDGAGGADAVTAIPTWTTEPRPPRDAAQIRSLQAFRSHEGRAPPVLPSI